MQSLLLALKYFFPKEVVKTVFKEQAYFKISKAINFILKLFYIHIFRNLTPRQSKVDLQPQVHEYMCEFTNGNNPNFKTKCSFIYFPKPMCVQNDKTVSVYTIICITAVYITR